MQCQIVNAKSEILLQHLAQWSLFTCLSIVDDTWSRVI